MERVILGLQLLQMLIDVLMVFCLMALLENK